MKKSHWALILLVLLVFLIPVEHKYDKPLRLISKTLVPEGLSISKDYSKKIYFYITDFLALGLLFLGAIPFRRFFKNPLWIVFFLSLASIIASPFIFYPTAYTRLLQLLTAILLFSFLANSDLKFTRAVFYAIAAAGLCQTAIAIAQYFHQAPLGLRILGEQSTLCAIAVPNGKRWIFDHFVRSPNVYRASATMGHPNVLGGFLLLSILATYYLKQVNWKWGLSLPFQLFALSVTYSRSAIFGFAIATIVFFIQKRDRTLALMVGFSVLLSSILLHEQFLHRGGIVNYNQMVKDSDSIRIVHQKTALHIIQEHPILGVGYAQFSERSHSFLPENSPDFVRVTGPHNIYLMLASETGLISLGAFLFLIFGLIWSFYKAPKTIEVAALSSIFLAFLFIGCCDLYFLIFQQGKLMFFLIAGLLAAHVQYFKQRELVHV